MFKSIAAAVIAATALAFKEPTAAEKESVKMWNDTMEYFGYNYEIHKATTDDDWELTLFRVIPKYESEESHGSVLVMHGGTMDATSWFSWVKDDPSKTPMDLPAMLRLADEGYDIWFGSNRGTKYSNVNPRLEGATEEERYDFSFYDFGVGDVPAMLDTITEVSGEKKVTYVGYSQGTSQIFYGLSKANPTLNMKLEKAILLAPCLWIEFGIDNMEQYN